MNKVIDGKTLALEHEELLREKIKKLRLKINITSILVGDDPASKVYTNLKQKKASELGISFDVKRFPERTSFNKLLSKIEQLNRNPKVNGLMIQLPLPDHLKQKTTQLLSALDPKKDIDGLTGKGPVSQAAVRGVLSILEKVGVQYGKDKIGVVGSEGFVGKALVRELENVGIKAIKVDKKLPETSLEDLKGVGVVISCVGINSLVKPEYIKSGAVLIDVGLGDFDEGCFKKASAYTPLKGGVGPMTVISLMENATELASKQAKES